MSTLFAGFSEDEWAACYRQIMPAQEAVAEARALFASIEASGGSNGYALEAETWALLGTMSADAAGRVASLTANYPDSFRTQIRAAMANSPSYRRASDE